MTNNSRVGRLGASQIAGLVKEYAEPLLENKIINQEIYDNLISMPTYLETKYSLTHKLDFNEDKLQKFQKYIYNPAMKRGHACEGIVMDDFLRENEGFKVIDEQARVEKKLKDVKIPLIATLDYIIEKNGKRYIHECKTTDNSIFYRLQGKIPFHYQLQLQMQMLFNDIKSSYITIAGIQTVNKNEYLLLESLSKLFTLDKMLAEAITHSVSWFDYELKNNKNKLLDKPEEFKTKADKEVDAFLEEQKQTKEIEADKELLEKIEQLKEMKRVADEFRKKEREIKELIKSLMDNKSKLLIKSNSFELSAYLTKPSFFDEKAIIEEITKAENKLEQTKLLEVGTPKSEPFLKYVIN